MIWFAVAYFWIGLVVAIVWFLSEPGEDRRLVAMSFFGWPIFGLVLLVDYFSVSRSKPHTDDRK